MACTFPKSTDRRDSGGKYFYRNPCNRAANSRANIHKGTLPVPKNGSGLIAATVLKLPRLLHILGRLLGWVLVPISSDQLKKYEYATLK